MNDTKQHIKYLFNFFEVFNGYDMYIIINT